MIQHDETLCKCKEPDDVCHCQCPKCLAAKRSKEAIARRAAIYQKFQRSGMSIDDLAYIILEHIGPVLEKKVYVMAEKAVKDLLDGATIYSVVRGNFKK